MRLLMVEAKITTTEGTRTASWKGAFDEQVTVTLSSAMDGEAFHLLVKHYVEAGVEFAEVVRCA